MYFVLIERAYRVRAPETGKFTAQWRTHTQLRQALRLLPPEGEPVP